MHPFSPAYGRIIIGFRLLILLPVVFFVCVVGDIIYLLKSFLISFTTLVVNQYRYELKLWNTFLSKFRF